VLPSRPSMPSHVPQREYWTGEQTELGHAWTLTKGTTIARCILCSHQFGHGLKLVVGDELLRSEVCRSGEQILTTHDESKAAMLAKAWTEI
jgi:hypothetical protein